MITFLHDYYPPVHPEIIQALNLALAKHNGVHRELEGCAAECMKDVSNESFVAPLRIHC